MIYNSDGSVKDLVASIQAQQSIRRKIMDRESRTQLSHNDLALLNYANRIKKYL